MVLPLKPKDFRAHSFGISSMALSKDEKTIVTGSNDNNIGIWDAKTFQNI